MLDRAALLRRRVLMTAVAALLLAAAGVSACGKSCCGVHCNTQRIQTTTQQTAITTTVTAVTTTKTQWMTVKTCSTCGAVQVPRRKCHKCKNKRRSNPTCSRKKFKHVYGSYEIYPGGPERLDDPMAAAWNLRVVLAISQQYQAQMGLYGCTLTSWSAVIGCQKTKKTRCSKCSSSCCPSVAGETMWYFKFLATYRCGAFFQYRTIWAYVVVYPNGAIKELKLVKWKESGPWEVCRMPGQMGCITPGAVVSFPGGANCGGCSTCCKPKIYDPANPESCAACQDCYWCPACKQCTACVGC